MEHPCYRCGANIAEGTPFCAGCGAPQIRVAAPEPLAPSATTPEVAIEHYTSHTSPHAFALDWPQALPSAGIALVVAIVIMVVSKSSPMGMLAAGFLSVVLYRRRCPATLVTTGMGARMGALTGVLGFSAVATILALWMAFSSGKEIRDALLNYIQQNAAPRSDPYVQKILDLFSTPEGFTSFMVLSLFVTLVVFLIFSSMGGAIAAFLLHRKDRR